MKQVVQGVSGGNVRLVEVPDPINSPSQVLVETIATVVSPGTERMVTQLAQSSLISKAKARPDLVRQVIEKAKSDGPINTLKTVRSRLDSDLPLGYSGCGLVRAVGEYVEGISVGDIVATGGASYANHAEFQAVPGLLTAKVPSNVSPADAAFSTIASISLHGLRLGGIEAGTNLVIIGLGLIGQIAARLGLAAGCNVVGIDIDKDKVDLLSSYGCVGLLEEGASTTEAVLSHTRGRGADLVVITAGGKSNGPIKRAPELLRDRGSIVIVGDVALEQDRTPLYMKELTLKVARSYGPGRYDRNYEEFGIDYPLGYVRFSEGRNMESVLDLLSTKRVSFDGLVSDRFKIDDAPIAYEKLNKNPKVLGMLFTYGKDNLASQSKMSSVKIESDVKYPVSESAKKKVQNVKIGLIGAGAYTNSVIVPKIKEASLGSIVGVVSETGLSAQRLANREGGKVFSSYSELIGASEINTIFVTTPHSSHSKIVELALQSKKNVWCEKPLCLDDTSLNSIKDSDESLLFVGFNRRFSPAIERVKRHFEGDLGSTVSRGPLMITYRVASNRVPDTHWYKDRREGGRLLGEVCHFIDTCSAIVGQKARNIKAFGSGFDAKILAEDVAVMISYEDGSIATITYSVDGHVSTPKERIEILGRKKTAIVDDFKSVELDGKKEVFKHQDKGQLGAFLEFKRLLKSGSSTPEWVYESSIMTIIAAQSLLTL